VSDSLIERLRAIHDGMNEWLAEGNGQPQDWADADTLLEAIVALSKIDGAGEQVAAWDAKDGRG